MIDIAQFAGLAGVGIVVALLQIAKGYLPNQRSWPVAALVIGIAWSVIIAWATAGPYPQAIVTGLVVALVASGMYSWGQTGKPPEPPKG
jgi:ABC-type uncharacterized transport system permease subunit